MIIPHPFRLFWGLFILLPFQRIISQEPADSLNNAASLTANELTLSYAISLDNYKENGVAESYNGGIKTIFLKGNKGRARLVSLMRIESAFLSAQTKKQYATLVKESGKKKYKTFFTYAQWEDYTIKYDSAAVSFYPDSLTILGYRCSKAIITLRNRETLTAYFTNSIRNDLIGKLDPPHSCVPGLILQLEVNHKKGTIRYTASALSFAPISPDVFKVPSTGYTVRKTEGL